MIKHLSISLITLYQGFLSPLLVSFLGVRSVCRYKISCSEYTKQQIQQKGIISGILLGTKRIFSCSPFRR